MKVIEHALIDYRKKYSTVDRYECTCGSPIVIQTRKDPLEGLRFPVSEKTHHTFVCRRAANQGLGEEAVLYEGPDRYP